MLRAVVLRIVVTAINDASPLPVAMPASAMRVRVRTGGVREEPGCHASWRACGGDRRDAPPGRLRQRGSFWWSPAGTPENHSEYVAGLVAAGPKLPLRVFLSAGLFETAGGGTAGILETSRHLRDVMEAKGIPVTYRDHAGGHDYLVWQGVISDGLIALFGGERP
jgi:hypothetical protein